MSTTFLNESSHLHLAQTLNELITREKQLSPAALARHLGIPTNKITRILNGDVTDPKASTLLQIAGYFDISIEQLLGIEPLVREGVAESQESTRHLPVFEFTASVGSAKPVEWYHWVESDTEGEYFAITLDTDLYEPTFPKHSLLIVNTDIAPEDRSFVLVEKKSHSGNRSIKKLVIEGSETYLYPINPKLPVEIYDDKLYNITGVILEVHQKLHTKK